MNDLRRSKDERKKIPIDVFDLDQKTESLKKFFFFTFPTRNATRHVFCQRVVVGTSLLASRRRRRLLLSESLQQIVTRRRSKLHDCDVYRRVPARRRHLLFGIPLSVHIFEIDGDNFLNLNFYVCHLSTVYIEDHGLYCRNTFSKIISDFLVGIVDVVKFKSFCCDLVDRYQILFPENL
jgi:hypothetical protein